MKSKRVMAASAVIVGMFLAGCASTDPARTSGDKQPTDAGRLITIDAGSPSGTRLGAFKKGQTITLQYVEGMWTVFTDAKTPWLEESPDDEGKIRDWHRCALCKYDGQKNVLATLLPGGTKASPFSYTIEDDGEMALVCNDVIAGNRTHNNKGTVTYRLDVK